MKDFDKSTDSRNTVYCQLYFWHQKTTLLYCIVIINISKKRGPIRLYHNKFFFVIIVHRSHYFDPFETYKRRKILLQNKKNIFFVFYLYVSVCIS